MFLQRKIKKILWSEYIECSHFDNSLLNEKFNSEETNEELETKIHENLIHMNNVCRSLRNIYGFKDERYHRKIAKIPLIGKIYGYYYQIYGRTFKCQGPITIIGKADKNDNYIYPNTRWNRITKLNKFIR